MRRLFAVVALLATTWPHIAVMGCVEPASSPVSATSSMVSEHEHGSPECSMVMVCTAVMIESTTHPDVVESKTPTVRIYVPRGTVPAAAVLTDEPPPPRRSA